MARTVDEIQAEIITAKDQEAELNALNSPSAVSIWRLWTRITATAIAVHEALLDEAIVEMEQIARDAIAGTADWLQRRILEFQYDASNPQVITVIDGRAAYPVVDESLRIITRASIVENESGRVTVKVAKGENVLEPLAVEELNALRGYLDKIGFVGVPLDSVSLNADRLRFAGTVFYSGEFVETTVKDAVKAAITSYLDSISIEDFDGRVVREDLIDAIQKVDGVTGVDTLNVQLNGRPEQDALGGGANVAIQRLYETFAGYIIEEDTPGNTFEDLIEMQLDA